MYKKVNYIKSALKINEATQGETIEQKVERILDNKEPIKDGAPLVYTDRKDGVMPGYNIRTDRWEVAVDAMDKVAKNVAAKRENRAKMEVVKDNGVEPIQGTNTTGTNE
jgi:hypothetical protein